VVKRNKRIENCQAILAILNDDRVFDPDASMVTPMHEVPVTAQVLDSDTMPDAAEADTDVMPVLPTREVVDTPAGGRGIVLTLPQMLLIVGVAGFVSLLVVLYVPEEPSALPSAALQVDGPKDTSEGEWGWAGRTRKPDAGPAKAATRTSPSTPAATPAEAPTAEPVAPADPIEGEAAIEAAPSPTTGTESEATRGNPLRRKRSVVTVTGNAVDVRYDRGQWLWKSGVELPGGAYKVEAKWTEGGEWEPAGQIKVRGGEPVTLMCTLSRRTCEAK